MANRPAWVVLGWDNKINKEEISFEFFPGFSVTQKRKSFQSMHNEIERRFRCASLEVSSKSDVEIGRVLSAFNLRLDGVPFECIFQSSKKYMNGGPYRDLLSVTPKEAKTDSRHHNSGPLVAFEYNGEKFPLEPKSFFYDYMYVKTVSKANINGLTDILAYDFFTDIEFNPAKSINCQAKSAAIIKVMLIEFGGKIPEMTMDEFAQFYKEIGADKC